jgi:RNA polymerase sigma-70 factor (ECF subfamily)
MLHEAQPQGSRKSAYPELDPTVVARAARGDSAAFSQIYAHAAPGIRRYVRTIVWDAWDADDVTQDVFVKILSSIEHYDPERAPFSAWTLRVARNAAIDHMRRHRTRPGSPEVDCHAPADETGRRCGESLRQVLEELNQHQREILVLRALAGFTPREVATHAHATPGSINTLYHRARLAARDRLRDIAAGPCALRARTQVTEAAPVVAKAA